MSVTATGAFIEAQGLLIREPTFFRSACINVVCTGVPSRRPTAILGEESSNWRAREDTGRTCIQSPDSLQDAGSKQAVSAVLRACCIGALYM